MEPIHFATHSLHPVLMLLIHVFGIFDLGAIADGHIDDMFPACSGTSAVTPSLNGQRYREDNGASFFSAIFCFSEDLIDVPYAVRNEGRKLASVLYDVAKFRKRSILMSFVFTITFHFALDIFHSFGL